MRGRESTKLWTVNDVVAKRLWQSSPSRRIKREKLWNIVWFRYRFHPEIHTHWGRTHSKRLREQSPDNTSDCLALSDHLVALTQPPKNAYMPSHSLPIYFFHSFSHRFLPNIFLLLPSVTFVLGDRHSKIVWEEWEMRGIHLRPIHSDWQLMFNTFAGWREGENAYNVWLSVGNMSTMGIVEKYKLCVRFGEWMEWVREKSPSQCRQV